MDEHCDVYVNQGRWREKYLLLLIKVGNIDSTDVISVVLKINPVTYPYVNGYRITIEPFIIKAKVSFKNFTSLNL